MPPAKLPAVVKRQGREWCPGALVSNDLQEFFLYRERGQQRHDKNQTVVLLSSALLEVNDDYPAASNNDVGLRHAHNTPSHATSSITIFTLKYMNNHNKRRTTTTEQQTPNNIFQINTTSKSRDRLTETGHPLTEWLTGMDHAQTQLQNYTHHGERKPARIYFLLFILKSCLFFYFLSLQPPRVLKTAKKYVC